MNERDIVSRTLMVAACTRASILDDVIGLFKQMRYRNTVAIGLFKQMRYRNTVAWTNLMAGFAQNGQSESWISLCKCWRLELSRVVLRL